MSATDIFSSRKISEQVREARGYTPWEAGHPEQILEAAPELRKHPQFVKRASQVSGWVMPKYAVPTGIKTPPVFDPVLAQLRPDEEVAWDSFTHDHARLPELVLEKHLAGKYTPDGKDVEGEHTHTIKAKYLLAPGNGSKRLDHNPLTTFNGKERVFFVIEGTPKNDSLVSAGEVAFNVPSVTLWDAPELGEFATRLLTNRQVFIVPDSDWAENEEVNFHALACREFLRSLGVNAWIAAPPPGENGRKNGVDDFLAAGGNPDDLLVYPREVPEAFNRWAFIYRKRALAAGRYEKSAELDIAVLRLLIEASNQLGLVKRSNEALAGALTRDACTRTVRRSLLRLLEVGAVTEVDGSVEDWREYAIPYKAPAEKVRTGRRKRAVRTKVGGYATIVPAMRISEELQLEWADPVRLANMA